MTKRLRRSTLFIVFLISITTSFAQKAPMRFGKVDIEDLKMSVYEKDTSAEAVILCDYGVFNANENEFVRHCRIKILKKGGSKFANVRVRVPNKSVVKAKTYNLENGEVVVSKMKGESVFSELIKGRVYAIRFSLPNVKVGSVIEYSYYFKGIPYSWNFQNTIPTIWSELRMPQSDYLKFQKNFFGYEPIDIVENERWVAKDMPAIREEPYTNSIHNYLTKFEFEISEIRYPGHNKQEFSGWYGVYFISQSQPFYKEFTTSWDQVAVELRKSDDFGQRLVGNLFLNKSAETIGSKDISDIEKVKEAYDFIKSKVTWDRSSHVYAYSLLQEVFNKNKGNSTEINLLLLSLLRKMDFNANPVVLSTRNNGILSPNFPSLNKLNYTIVCVEIDGKSYFMDATDKHAPFGILPKRCINGEAKVLYEKTAKSINMQTDKSEKEVFYAALTLGENGDFIGDISNQMIDYAAYDFRKELDDYTTQDEYIKKLQEDNNGLYINSYELENVESIYKPVKAKYKITIEDNVDVIGDNMYINPMLIEKIDNNPFKTEERKYPVDYIHPISKKYILKLSIPKGYVVDQLPKNTKVSLPDNKGSFTYQIVSNGSDIQFTYYFNISDPIILSTEYLYLKQFYNELIKKQSEMIVLKKIG